ncbi:hypothetical protein HMPREF9418_1393 [Neisseria macacae ATCC 33926]|uniref:Uncharacterized protein n=1 Tax=Neisseria macacae ATCC 33926 TaxID=997348 RepID=A0AA36XLC3_9NEIS|nr:hypothetical protein HMPREF9418_1393 [Neisseria macacae ATCC 33926]
MKLRSSENADATALPFSFDKYSGLTKGILHFTAMHKQRSSEFSDDLHLL